MTEVIPILYGPQDGKSLLRSYPDLKKDYPELGLVQKDELYFAWLIGIPGSPIKASLPDQQRYLSAATKAFPDNIDKRNRCGKWDTMPDEIKRAIRVFEGFNIDVRMQAKSATKTAFENIQKLLNIDVEKDFLITKVVKTGSGKDKTEESVTEIDWSGRKSYADSAVTMVKALPELVRQLEEGFGITEKKTGESSVKPIDIYHERNFEKS